MMFLRFVSVLQKIAPVFVFLFFQCIVVAETRAPDIILEIPMRDGVLLPANLYLPNPIPSDQKIPCVLVRHPLGKDHVDPLWLELVDAGGYALVVQSTRSCCDESGTTMPYLTDGWSVSGTYPVDGYDTVQWIAQQSFCSGKVAT